MKQLEIVRNTYNKTARAYAEQFFGELDGKPLDRILLERFAKEAHDLGTVVDLGCGSGQTTSYLFNCGIEDILGVDISKEMVAVAGENCPEIEFETGNMLDLRFEDNSIGAILAFYSIVHFDLAEVSKATREFYRVLKPGGIVLFSFHVGEGSVEPEEFLGEPTDIVFNYFNVDRVIENMQRRRLRHHGIDNSLSL